MGRFAGALPRYPPRARVSTRPRARAADAQSLHHAARKCRNHNGLRCAAHAAVSIVVPGCACPAFFASESRVKGGRKRGESGAPTRATGRPRRPLLLSLSLSPHSPAGCALPCLRVLLKASRIASQGRVKPLHPCASLAGGAWGLSHSATPPPVACRRRLSLPLLSMRSFVRRSSASVPGPGRSGCFAPWAVPLTRRGRLLPLARARGGEGGPVHSSGHSSGHSFPIPLLEHG